jgi:type IV secretion system protein VirD4
VVHGSGKSASYAIPNALQMLGSYIFTDPKGELYDRTAGILKKNGYNIHVINLADPKYSDGYNPLSHIRNTTDVDIITKIISKKDDKGGQKSADPFWDQTSEALLKAMIYYIMFNRPKEEHSLASCAALVRLGAENEGEDLMDIFKALPFDNPARRAFDTIRLGSEKTFSNILVSLAAKLEAFDSEEIAALTSCNTITFEDLAKEKSAVYFITPESHGTYDFLMNIFFSQLFQRLYEFGDQNGGALPIPMFLILDEFANIGRIPNFERILSTCRSKKLHISIILQSIDQLEEIYDEKVTQTIMANCSTQLFLGSNAQKTLETFSKLLGEKTISHDNDSLSTDKDNKKSGHSYSEQIMARALMTPDELRRMDTDDCIIFIQAMKPILTKKYWYYPKVKWKFLWIKSRVKPHPLYEEAKASEINHLSLGEQKREAFVISDPSKWLDNGGVSDLDDIWNLSVDAGTSSSKDTSYSADNSGISTSTSKPEPKNVVVDDYSVSEKPSSNASGETDDFNYDIMAEIDKRFAELFGSGNNSND